MLNVRCRRVELLRGLDVEDLTRPELTGQWEYKLKQMERGLLARRDLDALGALAVATLAVLALEPGSILDPSLQLSLASVAGLVALAAKPFALVVLDVDASGAGEGRALFVPLPPSAGARSVFRPSVPQVSGMPSAISSSAGSVGFVT